MELPCDQPQPAEDHTGCGLGDAGSVWGDGVERSCHACAGICNWKEKDAVKFFDGGGTSSHASTRTCKVPSQ